MTMDQRNNHLGSSMGFDHMPFSSGLSFSNPWNSGSSAHHAPQLLQTSMGSSNAAFDTLSKQSNARASTASMPYSSIPASAPSLSASNGYSNYGPSQLLDMSQDLLNHSRSTYDQTYTTAPSSINSYAPTSAPYANTYGSVAQPQQQDHVRRISQSLV